MADDRYARQSILSHVGEAGQTKLSQARVLVVGAGGLGCPVLLYLVGAGVGHITLVDHDSVSLSNLHRQVLYTEQDIGRFKVEAALSALKARNSEVALSAIAKPMTTRLAEELVPLHDVVLDAGDSLALSYALSDVCLAHKKPLISASVVEMAGYVGQFCAMADGTPLPSYRALFPSVPATIGSCDTLGVMGSAVGVMASLQAHMALSCLLGNEQTLAAKLFTLDFHSLNLRKIDFASALEPDAPSLPLLGVEDFEALDVVVELRGQNEVATLPTPNALRLLPEAAIAADLPKDQRLVLCCATGLRSSRVADALHRRGYTKLAIAALG